MNSEEEKTTYVPTTPFEYISHQIPKKALMFWILSIAGTIGSLGLAGTTIIIMGRTDIITILISIVQVIISLVFVLQATLIFKYSLKKGDKIILREHRGGIFSFDKVKQNQKIYFDPKDPTTEPTILWNGTGTEPQTGAKVILLKEGAKANENINLFVAETDWSKNLASMVRAKTFADIAETELLNGQTMFGLKWQDLLLIIIGLLVLGSIIVTVGMVPGMVSDQVIKKMLEGALQTAIGSIIK